MREQILFSGIGVVSIVSGLPLARRRVRPNRWYGLRIPATFADEHVWYEANAACGRDLVLLGCSAARCCSWRSACHVWSLFHGASTPSRARPYW